ncbi:hypothetical protein A3C21_04270 [Candidatus Kaiserbacteria bacterium RIFCSPHIGHO2_02_FULL_59_21]|uniref:UDP-N-acetylglucosamine kinase n=1 Tax=Candidatus Kaiserbacteria bacterium RIFCSPHIGHO2_02_FULL_59_21 TaxID=1798500 RepID=A0A1F6E023_9BACT|nr:MAG: hypothetical protein A3C21_04270 [Candidatus Kaiserbacteria bacterium RIFCSPHIGHO2_02_FULL_59_21]
MKLVILNGASCSGKSTVIENLMKQKERYFHLSYDALKWQFSQYASGKYYDDLHKLRLAILRALCELKYNVITEAVHKASRQKHIDIAIEYGYEIVEINLDTDYETLLKRRDERAAARNRKEDLSKERFDSLFNAYQSEKNDEAITFKTDAQSVEEITEGILKLL